MAGVQAYFQTGEVSLAAGVTKTVLQLLAAANHRVKVQGFRIYLKGTSPTDTPVKFRILRQTNAIGGSPGTVTGVKTDESADETLQTTATSSAGGTEPTAGEVLITGEIHPQTGEVDFFPFGQELLIKGGNRLAIELTAAQAQTAAASFSIEE